ncbi:ParM/StbA family protein [Leptolyngbya sp. FACHB-261]|uniref:ParM/StbA family protein n=1 Tax=Leptolyngbya sp. FACHB-261 TaxID=2692806 RepID=UPI001682D009|nr:ParM/StbA family protein [Leptolyngbya sp. FACHB-261]MBD2102072.1 ParM/StbA family protein [Leptolyngbya sp. FACHB-261]
MSVQQPETVLSIDLGRTSTKACTSSDPDQVILIPANVAHLDVDQVRRGSGLSGLTDRLVDLWLEYQGQGYAIGQLAADLGANLGVGQSKVDDALVKVLACIGYFGLNSDCNIVIGIPYHTQEQFEREKFQLMALLRSSHSLRFRGEPLSVSVKNVWVVPEGYGSLLWCQSQSMTHKNGSPSFARLAVAIVDIGHQTTDFLMVDRFRFARGASQSLQVAMSQFYEQVASQIEGADSQSLSLIQAVCAPTGERFYRPRGARQRTDLNEILPALQKSFARTLSNRLLDWLPERATDVILSGGGGEFFAESLKPLLSEAGLTTHLAQPSRLANALGQWLYGAAQIQPLSTSVS